MGLHILDFLQKHQFTMTLYKMYSTLHYNH